ncbi:YqcC family protein [Echinimonas agarilytica]|uniref:YqcC family protein n=1 Tax=Echinimonas agarilytica TaxID=1215918 RepID=A0AA42B6T5_9GAMM|nr:YqcC family protein [Echinimonas agarilytica]MCM2679117.1 YqcC family protein [Echinimonas agarilytica]
MCSQKFAVLLEQLQIELEQLGMWQDTPPSPVALASQAPFCVDTLRLEQWLQFIFIPRIRILLDSKADLPNTMTILPLAEEVYKNKRLECSGLLNVLGQIDGHA